MDGFRRAWFWVVGVAVLAAIAAVVLLGLRGTLLPRRGSEVPAPVREAFRPAPDFRLRGFDGGMVSLSDFRGSVVVLNFWASWCTPCKLEMPILEQIWREFKDRDVVVLGIDVLDDRGDAAAFLRTLGISYPNVHDPDQQRMNAYQVTGLPTTVFIDRLGRIRARYVGGYVGDPGRRQLRDQILTLLNDPPR